MKKQKQSIKEIINSTLKRHNGYKLVLLTDFQYAIIYPGNKIIRLGSSRSSALQFWYSYWKNKNKITKKRISFLKGVPQ